MTGLEQPADVLQRFCNGNLEAFEALFRQYQGQVYAWIFRIVRDPATAEELTIETFWRIHRAHARFDRTRGFGPWARRIATNVAIDYLKTRRKETELPNNLSSPSTPDPVISEELRRGTRRAFRRLPPKLQVTATLALIEEHPYSEIAEALGISTGAVKVRVYRAVRILRNELKREGIEP